jgi:hypothetical protein
MMTSTTQLHNDQQTKPLQNGFDPDYLSSEVEQGGPPSTEVAQEQLPQGRMFRPGGVDERLNAVSRPFVL